MDDSEQQTDQEAEQSKVEMTVTVDGEPTSWTMQNERVVEILANIPPEKLAERVELLLNVGDTVLQYASIQTSDATVQKLFGKVQTDLADKVTSIDKAKEKLEKFIAEQVPTGIKEKLAAELQVYVKLLQELKDAIPEKIKTQLEVSVTQLQDQVKNVQGCTDTLNNFIKGYKVPKTLGTLGENAALETLQRFFTEIYFENVSTTGHITDIKATNSDMVDVLVEVKNYGETVPKKEVDKFWRDLKENNTRVGCFLSLNTPIGAGIGDYKVTMQGDFVGVFLNVKQFFGEGGIQEGIQLAFGIARQFAQYLKRVDLERAKEGDLRQKVAAIYKEVGDLKHEVDRLEKISTDLQKINTSISKVAATVESVRNDAIRRITGILQGEAAAVAEEE